MSTLSGDIQPALDHLESALEASCASLIALESIRDEVLDSRPIHGQITRAVDSLRAAITEFRAMHDSETSMFAFGFVLAAAPDWRRAEHGTPDHGAPQVRPRRTA
jgi:hypothetical protein